jgi:LysM repeat protein
LTTNCEPCYNRFARSLMQARSTSEPELLQARRRRRDSRETERAALPRRPRRRRSSTPWLQRNALSVAAVSVLIAFLGLGFGLLQMLNRPDTSSPSAPLTTTLAQADLAVPTTSTTLMSASTVGAPIQTSGALSGPADSQRAIQMNVKVLDPNYTVASGDTLVRIAQRFNTTVERIQAFNSLPDPRALRVGTKLVIPPPL